MKISFAATARGETAMAEYNKTCGDCIHAEICKDSVVIPNFFKDNPAYCRGFKDRTKYVQVVRCYECKHYIKSMMLCKQEDGLCLPDKLDYCSLGERWSPDD